MHREQVVARLEELEDLIKSYGAVSLHLFPIEGFPGYAAQDVEEWARMNEQNGGTMSSSSVSPYSRREAGVRRPRRSMSLKVNLIQYFWGKSIRLLPHKNPYPLEGITRQPLTQGTPKFCKFFNSKNFLDYREY